MFILQIWFNVVRQRTGHLNKLMPEERANMTLQNASASTESLWNPDSGRVSNNVDSYVELYSTKTIRSKGRLK